LPIAATLVNGGNPWLKAVYLYELTLMDTKSKTKALPAKRVFIDGVVPARPAARKKTQAKLATPKLAAAAKITGKKVVARESVPLSRYVAPKRPKKVISRSHAVRKFVLRTSLAVVAVVLLSGGFLSWKAYVKLHKVFRGTTTVAALASKTVDPSLLNGEGDGRVNILLLGVGGAGHDGPDLTDTILILSVDPVNNTAALLSVPRDLWVKMPVNYFGSYQKINAAYESGKYDYLGKIDASNANAAAVESGFASIDQTMSDVLNIKINYHVLVNFQAFKEAIDTVGGVTVDVPTELYDPTMAWENNWNSVLAAAGVQQMNGTKALLYSRSRETSSDFARTERQRQIIVALKDKVLSAGTLSNPTKIDGLMNAFGDNVFSDMSTQGAMRLFTIMKKIDNSKISSIGLAQAPNKFVTTGQIGTASVVEPTAGLNNYSAIQNYVHSQLVDGYITKEHAAVTVYAATAANAASDTTTLQSYGYLVTNGGVVISPVTKSVVVDLSAGKDPYTKNYLEKRYGTTATTKLPSGLPAQPNTTKFVILDAK
jgi:LCP family protein required for cell wall assembly